MKGTFNGTVSISGKSFPADISIGQEEITFKPEDGGAPVSIHFADISDFRLLNYHAFLFTPSGRVEVAQLGYQTEDFFEKMWLAYDELSRKALFIRGDTVIKSEGDYAWAIDGETAAGIAKAELFTDCLCILPHNSKARRAPLCFARAVERDGFSMVMAEDTGEMFQVARLGRDTDPFYEKLDTLTARAVNDWKQAHDKLSARIASGEAGTEDCVSLFKATGADIFSGLFTLDSDGFWIAGVKNGKAAVELFIGEKAATYLYRFSGTGEHFLASLRHAFEAVGSSREIIYTDEETFAANPVYRMSAERCSHIAFLRSCNAGRIIHNQSWEKNLREFFAC